MNDFRDGSSKLPMRRIASGAPALVLLACVLLAFGCGGKGAKKGAPAAAPPPVPTGPLIAVAPLENRSNDLEAQEIVRGAFVEELRRRGANVMPTAESDERLREALGISYGGQLPSTTPAEVCRALGAEAVIYGEVTEWNKTTTGIYNSVSVVVAFRMYDRKGRLLWEGGDRQSHQNIPRGSGGGLGAEILINAIGSLVATPMTPFGKKAGAAAARKVPWRMLENPASAVAPPAAGKPAGAPAPAAAPPKDQEPGGAKAPPKTGGTP